MHLQEVSIEIIQKCPNNCIYCSSNSTCYSEHIISFDVYKRTIDDAVELGVSKLCISGGEPLLHPNLVDFVRYAKDYSLEVLIYTSGIIINSFNEFASLDSKILKELKSIGLDKLIFNVQAADEEMYNKIMGSTNCFPLMQDSIRKSVLSGIFTEIHFVPMKINYKAVHSVIKMAKQLGVKKISFLRLVLQGRALKNISLVNLSDEATDELKTRLIDINKRHQGIDIRIGIPLSENGLYGCNAGFGKLIIRYDGAVFPCEAFKYIDVIDNEGKVEPNNVNKESLKSIYFESRFLDILRSNINDFKSERISCEACPAQWRLKKVINQ